MRWHSEWLIAPLLWKKCVFFSFSFRYVVCHYLTQTTMEASALRNVPKLLKHLGRGVPAPSEMSQQQYVEFLMENKVMEDDRLIAFNKPALGNMRYQKWFLCIRIDF